MSLRERTAPVWGLSNSAMRDTVIFVVFLSLIIAAMFALVFFGMALR